MGAQRSLIEVAAKSLLRLVAFFAIQVASFSSHAGDRELASDGNRVILSIDDTFSCSSSASISIETQNAAYFDSSPEVIQKLVNTASAILGFECPRISHLKFIGLTDGHTVFNAEASKRNNWALQTDPAPLEVLALFFALREPSFLLLGSAHERLEKSSNITGIKDSYQFSFFEEQLRRLSGVANGDMDAFREYLMQSGQHFPTFDDALKHYRSIVAAIKEYAPSSSSLYEATLASELNSLKEAYWRSSIESIFQGESDQSVQSVLQQTESLLNRMNSPEFAAFLDQFVSDWLREEIEYIDQDIQDAPLYEIGWASDFVLGYPEKKEYEELPDTSKLISVSEIELQRSISLRLEALQQLAEETIEHSGSNHEEVNQILETGFAIAQEFQDYSFIAISESLYTFTIRQIDKTLRKSLPEFKQVLTELKLTPETVMSLEAQLTSYEELSKEFEAYGDYKEAIEKHLEVSKETICKTALVDQGIDESHLERTIAINSQKITLTKLSCDLAANGHQVITFERKLIPTQYDMTILDAEGNETKFGLNSEAFLDHKHLAIRARYGDNGISMDIRDEDWNIYIGELTEPPPTGEPNEQGIRECDELAADPLDPQKLAAGLDFESENIDPDVFERAIDACIAAVENDFTDLRQQYQLGRLFYFAGDMETAKEYLDYAASEKYPPAVFYSAEILLSTSEDPDVFIDALHMYRASGKAGYAPGIAMEKELNPDGIDFFKEIPPPSGDDILSTMSDTKKSVSFFGMTSYVNIVGIHIDECFQTSATDFSCEYKPIMKCGMSGWGNDPMVRFASAALQSDCDSVYPQFSSFRKITEKKWKKL